MKTIISPINDNVIASFTIIIVVTQELQEHPEKAIIIMVVYFKEETSCFVSYG